MKKLKEVFQVISLPVVFASMCCLSPIILVLFGLSTVSFAGTLSDTLYGEYKWLFRAIGFIALLCSLFFYFKKKKGICTLDEAKKRRNEIINTTIILVSSAVLGYIFFLYVVVHYIGVLLDIWK